MKRLLIFIIYFFFLELHLTASEVDSIIEHFKKINNVSFSFKQNINDKEEKGKCIIEYPKKIYCLYDNHKKKLLVSNGKNLVIKNQGDKDELYQTAIDIIKSEGKASTSFLQRKLQIGYNRAARIIDMMEADGIVSKANHVGKRDVL